jgi:citrate lyase gamma subunit
MSEERPPFTVNTLLGLPNKEFCDRVAAAGAETEEKRTLKDRVAKGLRGLQWKAVENQVRNKAAHLLEIDVMSLIASAWRHGKVADRLEAEQKAKGINATVPLQAHSIRTQLEPHIEIQFGDFVHRIVLDVLLDFELLGIILSIEDSVIKGIEAGSLQGFGEVKLLHVPILRRAFGPFDLPGTVHLTHGIPLTSAAKHSS